MQEQLGPYDDVKCPTCGVPWDEHTAQCSRHAYRPDAQQREAGNHHAKNGVAAATSSPSQGGVE